MSADAQKRAALVLYVWDENANAGAATSHVLVGWLGGDLRTLCGRRVSRYWRFSFDRVFSGMERRLCNQCEAKSRG